MEKIIKEAMNDTIIKEAIKKYDVSLEMVSHLGGFENFIYEYKKDEQEYVIRFVHSKHRSFEYVFAELEFIDYLAKNNANVSTVVATVDNELVFKVPCENNHYFTVCVFTKAQGTFVKHHDINDDFLEMFGKAVGYMHKLTKTFSPVHKRYHFHEEDYIELGRKYLKEEDKQMIEQAVEITEKIKAYGMNEDGYGLIHTDLHFGNMFYDQKELTFFDFDDASYKHFISDIAIIIFYTFMYYDKEDKEKTIANFIKPFLKGYETENKLDPIWIDRLNDFFRLRITILYFVIFAEGDELIQSDWGKKFTSIYRDVILNDTNFIDIEILKGYLWNS